MSSHWFPPIPIQHLGFHSSFLPSLTMRKLTLNILNLFNYSINLLICYPTPLPYSYPQACSPHSVLGCHHLTDTCWPCLGFGTPCWAALMPGCLLHPTCALTAYTSLPLFCRHPLYPALTLTPTWGSHLVWSVSCLIWVLARCSGALGFSSSGADAYLTRPHFKASGLNCHAREGGVGQGGKGRVSSFLNSKMWRK